MRKLVSPALVAGAVVLLAVVGLECVAAKHSESSSAQELPYDQAIRKYLADRASELEDDVLPDIRTAEAFEKVRPRLRREYLDMLGLEPLPERTPLKAVLTGRLEKDGYTVEKLHFQSRPGLYVTANLYLPRPAPKEPLPAILYLCGHASQMKRDGNKAAPESQSHGIWFATHGYVALVLDTLELGEIAAMHRGTLRHGAGGGTQPATLPPASSAGTRYAPSTTWPRRPRLIGTASVPPGSAAAAW